MSETYIYDNTEVKKTGRKAVKDTKRATKRSVRSPPDQDILLEVTPVDSENGSWKRWVKQADLYEIIETQE